MKRNNPDPSEEKPDHLSNQELLQLWQHFANVGGHDKDRMVTILTLLTPALTGVIGFAYITENDCQRQIAATAGLVTALVAAVVVLMYAGYANRNWAIADEIAQCNLNKVELKGKEKDQKGE